MQPCGIDYAQEKGPSFLLNIKITFGKEKQNKQTICFLKVKKKKNDFGDVEDEEQSHAKNFSEEKKFCQTKCFFGGRSQTSPKKT